MWTLILSYTNLKELERSDERSERFVGVLECPNVFGQFSLVPFAFVSKRCCVVSVAVFDVSGEAYV